MPLIQDNTKVKRTWLISSHLSLASPSGLINNEYIMDSAARKITKLRQPASHTIVSVFLS